ncbi:hypothetical protein TcG_10566 [Trypanosoma cruzi]|nr:hypothetical protein TcG_10566 [Trypanosoma cruzi]
MLLLLFGGENICLRCLGEALFVVSGHASHQHEGCEGPGRNIHLDAVMHAALRCLCMRVRLRVTEEGNACCAPCTAEATMTWVAPPYDEGKAIFRDHAQLCTISVTSGSLLPVVSWASEERVCGAGRFHWHILNKLCYGHPSPIQRALGPAAAHHRIMWKRLLPRSIRRQRRKSPPMPRRQRCALAQRHRGCAAGGGEEARSSGH